MREGWTYVDVRSVAEFDRGHPAGALNVPLHLASPALGGLVRNTEFVPAMTELLGKAARIVLGCQSGDRSARAADLLAAAGFQHLADQRAGFDGAKDRAGRLVEPGWARVGLPVEKGKAPR
jgi:rhodanese-related sulfurtransferase